MKYQKPLTKLELFEYLAEKSNLNKKDVAAVFEAFNEYVIEVLKQKGEVKLPDLGKFTVKQYAARMGINPQTKAKTEIPATNRAKFAMAKPVKTMPIK